MLGRWFRRSDDLLRWLLAAAVVIAVMCGGLVFYARGWPLDPLDGPSGRIVRSTGITVDPFVLRLLTLAVVAAPVAWAGPSSTRFGTEPPGPDGLPDLGRRLRATTRITVAAVAAHLGIAAVAAAVLDRRRETTAVVLSAVVITQMMAVVRTATPRFTSTGILAGDDVAFLGMTRPWRRVDRSVRLLAGGDTPGGPRRPRPPAPAPDRCATRH